MMLYIIFYHIFDNGIIEKNKFQIQQNNALWKRSDPVIHTSKCTTLSWCAQFASK